MLASGNIYASWEFKKTPIIIMDPAKKNIAINYPNPYYFLISIPQKVF